MINLIILKNPFKTDRELKQVPCTGEPVFSYIQPEMIGADVVISQNGRIVPEDSYQTVIPSPGDYIAVCPVIEGGGDGKDFGKILAAVVVSVVTMGAATAIAATGTLASGILATGVRMFGGYLVNSLVAPPVPDFQEPDSSYNPSYGWGQTSPITTEGNAIPITFGTVRMGVMCPIQTLAQRVETDGKKQTLNLLLSGGEGPVDYNEVWPSSEYQSTRALTVTGISDIHLNDQPLENFGDVQIYKRAGLNNQSIIPHFGDTYEEVNLSYKLEYGNKYSAQTIGNAGQGLELMFTCPQGLCRINDEGKTRETTIKIAIEYKLVEEKDWVNAGTLTISAAQRGPLYRTFRIDKIPEGQYEVRCTHFERDGDSERYINGVYWTKLSHISYDDFSRPNKVLLGIRALATDKLSGSLRASWTQTRSKVWVWNPNNPHPEKHEQKPANNPAWACYDLIHRARRLKKIHTGEYEFEVRGIRASRIDYQAFSDWADFCEERGIYFNGVIYKTQKLWDALKTPSEAGRGRVILRGTKFSCICDAPSQPVQMYTISNMELDSFKEEFIGQKDRANAIELSFYNIKNNYQKTTIPVYGPGYDEATVTKNPTQISVDFAMTLKQAYQYAKYQLRVNHYINQIVSWSSDVEAIASQVGDVVLIQHDVPQWGIGGRVVTATENTVTLDKEVTLKPDKNYTLKIRMADDTIVDRHIQDVEEETMTNILTVTTAFDTIPQQYDVFSFGELEKVAKPFRLTSVRRMNDFKYKLEAMEYIEEVYEEADDIPEIDYCLENPFFEVEGLGAVEETYIQKDGSVVSTIILSWFIPRGKRADEYYIYCSRNAGEAWTFLATTTGNEYTIADVKTGDTYLFRVCVKIGPSISQGIISNSCTVTGKNRPPNKVQGFTVIQQENTLKITIVPPGDPDIDRYELRMGGTSWETSTYIKQFIDVQTTIDVTQAGTQTFWVKAIDNSGNYAKEAKEFIADIHAVSNKYTIYDVEQNDQDWSVNSMFRDKDSWQIDSIEKIGDFELLADMFNCECHLCADAEVILNPIFLDESMNGDYVETFLSVFVDYDASDQNYIDIEYRTSFDGEDWSQWLPLVNHQFTGKYIQPRLKPHSVDGKTNVNIRNVRVRVDVTGITELIDFIDVPASGVTRINLKRRFFKRPMPHLFSYSQSGRQCTHEIVNNAIEKDEEGRWYFDVRLWDGDTQIAGQIGGNAKGY